MSWVERGRLVLGAFLDLMFVLSITKYLSGGLTSLDEWLTASLGISTLLVCALQQSQMTQPWAVIAGNTL